MTVLVNLYALLVVGLLGAAGCGLLLRLIRRCRGQGTLFFRRVAPFTAGP